MISKEPSNEEVEDYYQKLRKDEAEVGYYLNPDEEFTKELLESILVNKERYGYGACPCRLASGNKEEDMDIICPCDYRDPDLNDFGACYCGLYISQDILNGKKELKSIPERRPPFDERKDVSLQKIGGLGDLKKVLTFPIWRCKVCGYLCARDKPPEICPICKVPKERFEQFL